MRNRAATVAGVLGLGAGATVVRGMLFELQMAEEIDALLADARPTAPSTVTEADLERLPDPVGRWLRYSRAPGTELPVVVHLRQEGDFRIEPKGWVPYRASQYFTTNPPGFHWKATFRMAPLVTVTGRDLYRHGRASMQMRALGLVPLVNKSGGGLDQGDLLRYLGELQWFPAAALAGYIGWESLDAGSARATMTHGGISAAMTFTFGADGRLLESRADRYNDARGRNEAWVNRNDADGEFGGIRIPVAGEARWEYDTGPAPYIRWRITDVRQEGAPPRRPAFVPVRDGPSAGRRPR